MLIVPAGSFAAIEAAQGVARDLTLAQLDIIAVASGGAMHAATSGAVDPFTFRFSIFMLAIFVGYYVVWSVTARSRLRRAHLRLGQHFRWVPGHAAHARHVPEEKEVTGPELTDVR